MSDLLRLTGMYSGMDTETIVNQLVSAKQQKVTNLKNDQKKLEWKQNIWQDLNKKIYSLYTGTLSKMRLTGSYALKSTKVSDSTKATVVASDSAVTGTQTLQVKQLAKSGYLTGAKLDPKTVTTTDDSGATTMSEEKWTVGDKLGELGTFDTATLKVTVGGEEKLVTLSNNLTIEQTVTKLKEAGVNASFDETNQRFFISAKSTGKDADFKIEAVDENGNAITSGTTVLDFMGINENDADSDCARIKGQDAEILLNGATFTSASNTFSVNGLTITATGVTDEEISITTDTDYDGIYDMIKEFISDYNEIINDVYTRYNAESASKYTMLSDEEKESMSDDEVEKWEDKIKSSLLRKDNTLYSIMNMFQSTMADGYEVNGKKMYLFSFGIEKLNYFDAEENEKYAYHINGDPDDESTATKDDELKAAIATDPEGTIEFFAQLSKTMYNNLHDMMTSTDYRSIYKVYDDKRLQSEYDDYTKKIKEEQEKVDDYEDRWYEKFSAMEVALSKLQSNQSAISSMLGSN